MSLQKVVKLTSFSEASEENVTKMTTFSFQFGREYQQIFSSLFEYI